MIYPFLVDAASSIDLVNQRLGAERLLHPPMRGGRADLRLRELSKCWI